MAVTNQLSAEATIEKAGGTARIEPASGGPVRYAYFKHTQSGAGDATSTVVLRRLPGGKLRILGAASVLVHSAFGSSRVLDVGYAAHVAPDGTAVAAAAAAMANDLDVASAGSRALTGFQLIESDGGVDIVATVAGGTIPDAATLEGYIAYLIG